MENTNNLVSVDNWVDEINKEIDKIQLVEDTEHYTIVKLPDGKFRKEMKYIKYMSHMAETEEEEIELFRLLSSVEDNDDVIQLRTHVGKEINIVKLYTSPYESFDEETGENRRGVSTIMIDDKGIVYATSSKTVYYSLIGFCETFGWFSDTNDKFNSVTFKVTGKKALQGVQIGLSLVKINR